MSPNWNYMYNVVEWINMLNSLDHYIEKHLRRGASPIIKLKYIYPLDCV